MTDRQIINKIKQLSQIQPENEWREKVKRELLSQIRVYKAEKAEKADTYRLKPELLLLRPVVAISLILAIIFGGSVVTVQATKNSLPGQFLYPIKIALEKGRLILARKGEKKVDLELEFAGQRLEELGQIVQIEPEKTIEAVQNFQNNLDSVKVSLQKLEEDDKIIEDKIIEAAKIVEKKAIETKNEIEKAEKKTEDPIVRQVLAEVREYLTKKNFVMALTDESGIKNQESGITEEQIESTEITVTQTAVETEAAVEEIPDFRKEEKRKSSYTEASEDKILEEPEIDKDFYGGLLMEPEKGVYGGLLKN